VGFKKIETTVRLLFRIDLSTKEIWPSCKDPIVGTNPILDSESENFSRYFVKAEILLNISI
jgi:hypothetical protein